jgi:hypothetical protein
VSRYYSGPISDHFDGERFFDPNGTPPGSRRNLLRWSVDRHWRGGKAKWPLWAPSPYADRPPQRVEGALSRISYVGHASFLLQTAGLNVLFDPVWSKRASPFRHLGRNESTIQVSPTSFLHSDKIVARTIGIGARRLSRRVPCHTTRHAGPHRAVRWVEVNRQVGELPAV